MITLKKKFEVDLMREAAKILVDVLYELKKNVQPGISTKELDLLAEKQILSYNATPAFKGYSGYPSTICASVNNVVVHGIPNKKKLKNGDIISIDVGVKHKGYFSDAARTFAVGDVDSKAKHLMAITEESLSKGIEQACRGKSIGDIGYAVQKFVESNNMSVVKDFVGHGIGTQLHEDPQIPNFGKKGEGIRIKAGMVLAIEPMVNIGTSAVKILSDGWTVVTNDNSLSAHFENTVVVTDNGPEILTKL